MSKSGRKPRLLAPGPIRRRVLNSRNSYCNVPLDWLDWSNWWTDVWPDGSMYLHVEFLDKDDGRVERVRCRMSDRPRLRMMDGELYWLIDEKRNG